MAEKWICVRMDARGLWTADLCSENDYIIKNLGGSYPKSASAKIDALRTWGRNLKVRIIPYAKLKKMSEPTFFDSLPDIEISETYIESLDKDE